ncbi:MAG: hypothetical protein H6742_06880 [Alphaproteobacteria bacterium]|nr:hypothetical protein [Alphaproteobacteria bacterium]
MSTALTVRLLALPSADDVLHAASDAVAAAGGEVVESGALDPDDLAHAVLQASTHPSLTVICGGALGNGIAATVAGDMDGPIAAFAELLRVRWLADHGADAVLVDAAFGPHGAGVLLVVPGPAELVARALTELALPLAPRWLAEGEEAGSAEGEEPVTEGISVQAMGGGEEPPTEEPASKRGWKAALDAMGGTLDTAGWPAVPESFDRIAPARNVLDTAGERGLVTLADGRKLGAFGFPDLRRASSKVLLVGDGEPLALVVALHRHPLPVGVCVHGKGGGSLPSADLDPDPVAVERTGRAYPGFGTLFAATGDTVYVARSGKVYSWDGSNEREEGTDKQVLASLMLRWSQR